MEKKGSNTIPFLVRIIKNITEFIAEGDSKSLLSTLYSLLYFILCALCFNVLKPLRGFETNQPDKEPSPSPSAYPAPKPILAYYERHVHLRRC